MQVSHVDLTGDDQHGIESVTPEDAVQGIDRDGARWSTLITPTSSATE